MRFSAAVSSTTELDRAIAETAETALSRLGGERPDIAIVFVSEHHRASFDALPRKLADAIGTPVIVGCSAAAVIGDGRELEERAGFALTLGRLPDVEIRPFHIAPEKVPPRDARASDWEATLGVAAHEARALILLPDPFTFEPEPVLTQLDAAYPATPKIGGLASGGRGPGAHALFTPRGTHHEGLAGFALTGSVAVDTVVAQGCRPIDDPMFVTRCKGHLLFEVNGRPVIEVLAAIFGRLGARDQELFRSALHLGLAMREAQVDYRPGDFLIRNVLGVDERQKALIVGAFLHETQIVQFHVRDAEASRADLEATLMRHRASTPSESPAGALLFSCLGRGMSLYGLPDHDTDIFRRHMGTVPLGGFFCNGEIGPVGGFTFLHGYTSAFGLFRAARNA